jgi:hypothetical protein
VRPRCYAGYLSVVHPAAAWNRHVPVCRHFRCSCDIKRVELAGLGFDHSLRPSGLRADRLIAVHAPPPGARSTVQPTTKRQSIEASARKRRHRWAIRSANIVRVYAPPSQPRARLAPLQA